MAEPRTTPPGGSVEAVIFDLDGVVTDTAAAHAAAWKRLFDGYLEERAERLGEDFAPFDEAADYRAYVDGKPRYDGVRSFLESRGIELPFGDPDDAPQAETICGLGNRKNRYFLAWLERHRPRVYPGTAALLERLRAAGVKTGLFTSSRNGAAVVEAAGVAHLFDATVDGVELAELGIAGKPDPAMLRELAARLDADVRRTVVVEDAVAGVQAGAAGGFGFVIGLDRDDYGDAMAAAGADLVAHDLAELRFDAATGFAVKTLRSLPPVWQRRGEIEHRLRQRRLAVFLDYDGTLTPIVDDYRQADLSDDMRAAVGALAERCPVAIISGRDLADLKRRVKLESVIYAGSHGFEIGAPLRPEETLDKGEEFLDDLDEAERQLRRRLDAIAGADVERKRFAIAVHYRRAGDDAVPRVERAVDDVVDDRPRLRKGRGKKVFQVQPRIRWDKGRAIGWLLDHADLQGADVLPTYVGDDLTDEDGFRLLAGRGLCIAVGDEDRPTAADYRLAGPDDVARLLRFFAEVMEGTQR